jgi:hypothetical protein
LRSIAGAGIAFWSSISALTSWFFLEFISRMGYVGYFYAESKSFELRVSDGSQNIKLTEWGRMNLSTVYLGEMRLVWLVRMMNELVSETTGIGACRDHRLGGSVMFLQKRMNKYGRFMEITEYGRRGRRSFVVIPEGREGQGWRQCILQMGRLVKYLEQVRDTTKKSLPVQPRGVVPGRTFADVVEGKKPENGTEKREECIIGISAAEINVVTVENSKKGKEKILAPINQTALKWEDLVVILNEGVFNMRNMRDTLEDIKGKLEILGRRYELECVEKKKENMDCQHGPSGPKVQLGQEDGVKEIVGPRFNKPNLCCSKTYYRRRYRAVAKRRATRMLRREQKGTEMSPEGSPEVRHPVATDQREQKDPEMSPELSTEVGRHDATDRCEQKGPEISCCEQKGTARSTEVSPEVRCPIATDRREQMGLELSSELTPEVKRSVATDCREQKGPETSPELSTEIGRHVATERREQKGPEMLCRKQKGTEMSPEVSPKIRCPVATGRSGQKGPEMSPEVILEIRRPAETDYLIEGASIFGFESSGVKVQAARRPNKADQTMGQSKNSNELEEGCGLETEDDSGMCVVETDELLGVGEGVDAGLEDIAPDSSSNNWVIDTCMEFYPKVGVTCEGKESNMKRLFKDIEDARQQPDVEEEGITNSAQVSRQMRELKKLDTYVNYERGRSDVQLGKGRGRGRKGVL